MCAVEEGRQVAVTLVAFLFKCGWAHWSRAWDEEKLGLEGNMPMSTCRLMTQTSGRGRRAREGNVRGAKTGRQCPSTARPAAGSKADGKGAVERQGLDGKRVARTLGRERGPAVRGETGMGQESTR